MVNVVIADDHLLVREAWKLILAQDKRISVVALCDDGGAVVQACRDLNPHVVLMDINMQPVNGIEATRQIRSFSEGIKIIGISIHNDFPYVKALMQAGANGYVTKNSSGAEMIDAIFKTMDGQEYYCEEILEKM
ncbi:MAG: response regulator transcription factor [Sphingobacteriales bacterium]|nr:MAG: response regulator transcription factor [Sphingobacteriales bacterium]